MNEQMLEEALNSFVDSPSDPTSGIYFYPKSEKFLIKDVGVNILNTNRLT